MSAKAQPSKWPVQDAKARFSEMLNRCVEAGPQIVTRHGKDAAVILSVRDWERLKSAPQPSLKALLLCDTARGDIPVPDRRKVVSRPPPDLT